MWQHAAGDGGLPQQRAAVANIANVRFLEADVENLPYSALIGADFIDMVVANLCMSQAIIARAHTILLVGGCLIFAALHRAQWQETERASRFAYDAHTPAVSRKARLGA